MTAEERAWRILEYVAEHGTPPEPTSHSMMVPAQFPGAGFVSGGEIVGAEINAYAELVGWRCRFEPVYPRSWAIVYPKSARAELPAALVAELDANGD